MSGVLAAWNEKAPEDAIREVLACCGSRAWAAALVAGRPYGGEGEVRTVADAVWWSLGERDWLEAFASHPRIGERPAAGAASGDSLMWSGQEQSLVWGATDRIKREIAGGNDAYAARFGFNYIVCATDKSSELMLDILKHRMKNVRDAELREAAEQQREITQIRLGKWMEGIRP